MTSVAISIKDLTKTFGRTRALDGFDLDVPTGSVTGFLGPNGAGKSTTMRVLLGLLRPESGTATLLGGDPWRDAVDLHARLAYVPGDVSLWPNLTGGQVIDLLLRGRRTRGDRAELLDAFDLDPRKKGRTYSKGNRQKVALVAAFHTDAELYLLDEPTSGLDPLMEEVFTRQVRALRDEGRTVLLSSHILGEVEKLCDHVAIIREGRDVESGSLAQLRHLTRSRVTAVVDGARLAGVPGIHDLAADGDRVTFALDARAEPAVLAALGAAGATGVSIAPASLEELFLRHYDQRAEKVSA